MTRRTASTPRRAGGALTTGFLPTTGIFVPSAPVDLRQAFDRLTILVRNRSNGSFGGSRKAARLPFEFMTESFSIRVMTGIDRVRTNEDGSMNVYYAFRHRETVGVEQRELSPPVVAT